MRNIAAFCITALVLASLGCGDPQPEQTDDAMSADPGAGTVLRVDPALDALVPADYQIEKLSDGFAFTEGPVWISDGSYLLFSDLRSNRIHKWEASEGLTTFMDPVFEGDPAGRSVGSNGLNIDSEGRLILLEHGNRLRQALVPVQRIAELEQRDAIERGERGSFPKRGDRSRGATVLELTAPDPTQPGRKLEPGASMGRKRFQCRAQRRPRLVVEPQGRLQGRQRRTVGDLRGAATALGLVAYALFDLAADRSLQRGLCCFKKWN